MKIETLKEAFRRAAEGFEARAAGNAEALSRVAMLHLIMVDVPALSAIAGHLSMLLAVEEERAKIEWAARGVK